MLLLVRHLLLVAWHLFLIANIVTTSKALATLLVTSALLVVTMLHLFLIANLVTTSKALVTTSVALVSNS